MALDRRPAVYSLFTMAIETEIKFSVSDLPGLAQRLQDAGFNLLTPRSFESNILYDTPVAACAPAPKFSASATTPAAGPSPTSACRTTGPGEDSHKHRVETETEVADGNALAEVFLSLGLVAAFRYEKWRTEWQDGEGHCVVDETPIGNYAELEGSAEWIDRAAARLGIRPADYITLSYGRLFDQWRDQHNSSATDLTFQPSPAPLLISSRPSCDSPVLGIHLPFVIKN